MKKKTLLAAAVLAALAVPQVAGAEGFGIVQWSAEGVAMGGARMFAENDVSMVAANPASLTKFQGKGVGINATYISPHGQYDISGVSTLGPLNPEESGKNRIHPGIVPGAYYVKQMTDKDWFGIGMYTRYGMVSGFQPGTWAAANNLYAKMNGLSITPTYAHKFDKKWSAAVGLEVNYVSLELNKDFSKFGGVAQHIDSNMSSHPALGALYNSKDAVGKKDLIKQYVGTAEANAYAAGTAKQMQLKGDTFALGWNAAVNYSFDEKNDLGVVYRSKVKHSLEADVKAFGVPGTYDAYGVVTLPDQWTIGYNHKFDEKNRVELNATRTNWHTYDALNIYFGSGFILGEESLNFKGYSDTWRYAIGYEHKFSDKYTGMLGFSWDDHAIPYEGGDFIVPTGLRRTYSIGMQYHDKKQTAAIALGWEKIGDLSFKYSDSQPANVHTHNNYAKIVSVGYSYKF